MTRHTGTMVALEGIGPLDREAVRCPSGPAPTTTRSMDGDVSQALQALGASPEQLTDDERRQLDERGYVLLEDVLDQATLDGITARLEALLVLEGLAAGAPAPTSRMQSAAARGATPAKRLTNGVYNTTFRSVRALTRWALRRWPDLRRALAPNHPPLGGPHGWPWRELLAMASVEAHQECHGVRRLCNLVDKGPEFDGCLAQPRVMACVAQLLGPCFKLSSFNARMPGGGTGLQPLHVDWLHGVESGECYACNTLWYLDDADAGNGGTRVVPGSHRWRHAPLESLGDSLANHPDELVIEARRGSVLVLNSHLWHGGTHNGSGRPRRILQGYYSHRAAEPQTVQRAHLSAATRERLGPHLAALLDVELPV